MQTHQYKLMCWTYAPYIDELSLPFDKYLFFVFDL